MDPGEPGFESQHGRARPLFPHFKMAMALLTSRAPHGDELREEMPECTGLQGREEGEVSLRNAGMSPPTLHRGDGLPALGGPPTLQPGLIP